MGLSIAVGILAHLMENDGEGAGGVRMDLAVINRALRAAGHAEHREPEETEVWGCDLIGYSGLHYLRRLAAYVDSGRGLPSILGDDENPADDSVLEGYYEASKGQRPSLFGRLFGGGKNYARRFDHLILHSDAVGYYVPVDFPGVLFLEEEGEGIGYMVGSSQRLLAECERLRSVLGVPEEMDEGSDALSAALEVRGEGDETWQRYGVESYVCVGLVEACKRSIRQGAVIAFC